MTDDPHNRRAFFRQVVKRYVAPAVDYLDAKSQGGPVILRPPGALPELEFLDRCERCHACVASCPAGAIRPIKTEGAANGSPGIVAETQPCVVCSDLSCMSACPSGALQVIPRQAIDMGLASVNVETCLRSSGDPCRLCVDLCPIGDSAIRVGESGGIEVGASCVGCGVCEQACPTTPKSIAIEPNPLGVDRKHGEPTHRQGTRGIILSPDNQILLMHLEEPDSGTRFWITPGGGLEPGESETVGLLRELTEVVGVFDFRVGAPVWKRSSRFVREGKAYRQQETYYVVAAEKFDPGEGGAMDGKERAAFNGFRWWALAEIRQSDETFAPRHLADLLQLLIDEGPPESPIDA